MDKEKDEKLDPKDVKKKIEDLITALGCTGEFLGGIRDSLMMAGFSRQEAVYMCSNLLVGIITKNKGDSND